MKLLLVEDEKTMSRMIAKGLQKLGYAVDCAYDGEEAIELYEINSYDLIILDLNIPKLNGMQVLEHIRKENFEIKILILSARNLVEDKIEGLNKGSNDYLVKPFDFRELEARIHNLLRRNFTQTETILTAGPLKMDVAAKRLFVGQEELTLTKKEFSILEYFMYHKDHIISAEELMEHVWDSEIDPFSNTIKFHIHSLRKKLASCTNGELSVCNIRGQGYRLQESREDV